ncbi:MAG TPA: GNAT family N-acetyltransferase [Dongiaceae bacterium]|nr:GNAT family N-acetyltransferase [Dongiaceae bacterium]
MPHFAIASRTPLAQPAAIVRVAALHEHAAIADLMLRANRDYRTVLPARIYDAYMRDLRALVAHWSDKDFLIAESDKRLLGAVAFYRDASHQGHGLPQEWAGIRALSVDPEARGRGIGRQLAEACVLWAWRIGRQVLSLHNAEFQSAARKLYLSMGFQRCPQYDFNVGDSPELDLKGERLAIDAFCLDLKR